jgi:aerobic carbon-monoxide dehydrogenase medium subunit
MKPAAFEYSTDQALLGRPDAKPLAGGQSLGPMLNLRLARPAILVDVKHLRGVTEHADWVRLGAATTHANIEDGSVPDPTGGLLRHVARGIAYRAVRQRGTLGGSLAHADPAADWPSVMAALGATIITSAGRRLPAETFMTAPFTTALRPGEIITAIEIPRHAGPWGHCKLNRKTGEFAHAIGIALPSRLLVGAIEAPPLLVTGIDEAPTPLSRVALSRAIAMRDA